MPIIADHHADHHAAGQSEDAILRFTRICLLTPALLWAWLGGAVRYMADDYFTAALLAREGFLESQRLTYMTWTGRYSFTCAVNLAELAGPWMAGVLPALLLLIWVPLAVWAVAAMLPRRAGRPQYNAAAVLGVLLVFLTLNGSLNIAQSFFWQTGSLTYTAPLIFLMGLMGVMAHGIRGALAEKNARTAGVAVFLLALVAGGFSDAFVFLQLALAALALCIGYAQHNVGEGRREIRRLLWMFFLGAATAFLLVTLAPGNAVRRAGMPAPPTPLVAIWWSLKFLAVFVAKYVWLSPLSCLLTVLFPCWLTWSGMVDPGISDRARIRRWLWIVPAGALALALACVIPAAWATSVSLPNRAWIIPEFVLVAAAIVQGLLLGVRLGAVQAPASGPRIIRYAGLSLVLIVSLAAFGRTARLIPRAWQDARRHDQNERLIDEARRRGIRNIEIQPIAEVETHLGARYTEIALEPDPENSRNRHAAQYYGVAKIMATAAETKPEPHREPASP
ncbi:MAG: DUF6056 family protein [Blastocatellia bacterium]